MKDKKSNSKLINFNEIRNNINKIKNINPKTKNSKIIQKRRLISFTKFKKFVKNNINDTLLSNFSNKRILIEVKNSLNLYKNRFTNYKSPSTNNQFFTVYDTLGILYINKLSELLSYFMIKKNIKIALKKIKNKKKDKIIYNFIKKNYKMKNSKNRLLYYISKISDKINKYINKYENKKTTPKILDVGVGNGKKLNLIKQFIECDIYGTDIKSWGPYDKKVKNNFKFPFKYIKDNPYKIPYDNKMFDCIILILTLHHCEDIKKTINECKRILKDDGLIVIVEHDIWNDYDNMIIDIQHNIYTNIFNEKKSKPGKYFNFIEWDIIFNDCKMKPIYGDRISENINFRQRYDLQFLGIYKKTIN